MDKHKSIYIHECLIEGGLSNPKSNTLLVESSSSSKLFLGSLDCTNKTNRRSRVELQLELANGTLHYSSK